MGGKSLGGKILRVDITSGKVTVEPTEAYTSEFLGGRGIDTWILYNEVKPWVTPYDPANRLIFGTGSLSGTLAPGSCRLNVGAKSPVTGGIGSSSAGGFFSAELKYAGYDHIVIEGKAKKPVYITISDEHIEIKNASNLWGRTTTETEAAIKKETRYDNLQMAYIGPAGENLVRHAPIVVNRARVAGRCGLGAVMGSKNLKAIAVRGSKAIHISQPQRFMKAVDETWKKVNESVMISLLKNEGLMGITKGHVTGKPDYAKNFQDIADPDKLRKIMPDIFREKYQVRKIAPFACPVGCFRIYEVKEGPYAGTICNGFPANDIDNFGIKLGIDYPPAILKAHDLCSDLGLDEDSCSGVIAWAFECYERGILSKEFTGGLEFKWGDHRMILELLDKIANRQGLGDLLAEGCLHASEIIGKGSEEFCIHIKGQDNFEIMRGEKGWALGCVVSTRGGTHLRGAILTDRTDIPGFRNAPPQFLEKWGLSENIESGSYENKAKPVIYCENYKGVADSLGICWILTTWLSADLLGPEDMAELYSAATGHEINAYELMVIGDRIHNLEKAFNVLHVGFNRQDDYPPKRFMDEAVRGGKWNGERLQRKKWDVMLDEYYELREWDKQTSWQTRKCLEDLGLKQVADDLEKARRMPQVKDNVEGLK